MVSLLVTHGSRSELLSSDRMLTADKQLLIRLCAGVIASMCYLIAFFELDGSHMDNRFRDYNTGTKICALLSGRKKKRSSRRWYIYPRANKSFARLAIDPDLPSQLFYEDFRISKSVFEEIHRAICRDINHVKTNFRTPIPTTTRLLIFLYYISCAGSFRTTANTFGIGKSTASDIVREVSI